MLAGDPGHTWSMASESVAAKEWWGSRRLRYNIGLVVAGILAFICYVIVVFWGISLGAIPDAGAITLLTTVFQGIGYLFMMAVANLCYFLGPWSERFLQPKNPDQYRTVTFRLGFWFSVLLPFTIPGFLTILCLTRPAWWHG
jgi:hypothetical protein